MIAPLTNDTVLWLAVIAGLTLYGVVSTVARAFGPDDLDEDELADRIETAIKDATGDLLDALSEMQATLDAIRDSNQAILDDSDEAPGTSLHGLTNSWGRPRGFRPAETTPPYEFVDLHKHD